MITLSMTVEEVLLCYPKMLPVFAQHGLACPGCSLAAFDSLEEAAKAHDVDLTALIRELNDTAAEACPAGTFAQ